MLAGTQSLPSTQLQGMTENFSMPTGTPSLMDDMATPSLGGGIPIDTNLPGLNAGLMTPLELKQGMSSEQFIAYGSFLNDIDPTNIF